LEGGGGDAAFCRASGSFGPKSVRSDGDAACCRASGSFAVHDA
jgi:hypothetical protein